MGKYDFKEDLPVALSTQKEVAELLKKKYNAEILETNNKTNKYDILARIRGREVSFEVKEDFMSGKTGNIAVEYSCRGKPSGIETTQADYYIYKLHRKDGIEFVLHTVPAIKQMIEKALYFRLVNGGDEGSNSLSYLFKYNIYMRTGKLIAKIP